MKSDLNYVRFGKGDPILLIHGLGGSWRSWTPVFNELASSREIIAIDLPGFGESSPLIGEISIEALSDAVTKFIKDHHLMGIDVVGSSMGARIVLELVRRGGIVGSAVSLDPGGFWKTWEKYFFYGSLYLSIRLLRIIKPILPLITKSIVGRTLLFSQFSAHPSRLSPKMILQEITDYINSKSFDELLYQLAFGTIQLGTERTLEKPLSICWGKRDKVCFPLQAKRALKLFPHAKLKWFNDCGHFPHWDQAEKTAKYILENTKFLGKLKPVYD